MGELKVIEGADWNLEIGALRARFQTQRKQSGSALRPHQRLSCRLQVLVGFFESLRRLALTTNLPLDITRERFVQACRERLAKQPAIPPVKVSSGPVMENIYKGDDIDLFKFPVPFWQQRDGGRYIGTGHIVITRDPDEGWVN